VYNEDNECFVALPVPDDGNCVFFHAILYFVEEDHKVIRQK